MRSWFALLRLPLPGFSLPGFSLLGLPLQSVRMVACGTAMLCACSALALGGCNASLTGDGSLRPYPTWDGALVDVTNVDSAHVDGMPRDAFEAVGPMADGDVPVADVPVADVPVVVTIRPDGFVWTDDVTEEVAPLTDGLITDEPLIEETIIEETIIEETITEATSSETEAPVDVVAPEDDAFPAVPAMPAEDDTPGSDVSPFPEVPAPPESAPRESAPRGVGAAGVPAKAHASGSSGQGGLLSEKFATPSSPAAPATNPLPVDTASSSGDLGDLPGFGGTGTVQLPKFVEGFGTPRTTSPRTTSPRIGTPGSTAPYVPANEVAIPLTPAQPTDAAYYDEGIESLELPPASAYPRMPGEPAPITPDAMSPVEPSGFPEPSGFSEDGGFPPAPDMRGPGSDSNPGTEPRTNDVDPDDPFGEPVSPTGSPDEPSSADGAMADDPWGPPSSDTPADRTATGSLDAPAADDPWGPSSSDAPASGAGSMRDDPGLMRDDPVGRAPTGDDPWAAPADSSPAGGPLGNAAGRVQSHVTLLRDRPGNPDVAGYPTSLITRADASVALSPGRSPCVLVFYDDTSRGSDLTAARILATLVKYSRQIDIVPVDRGPRRPAGPAYDALARRYLNGVPTVVVLAPDRRAPQMFWRDISAAQVDAAIVAALRAPAAAPVAVPDAGAPGEYRPAEGLMQPERTPAEPAPLAGTADRHARRLRDRAGDPALVGYPTTLLRTMPAKSVLEPGRRPAVIIFYDNTSKASDQQAADFLPILTRYNNDVDLVLMDVSTEARWNAVERKVVLTYYMSFVPTTVVLTARRAPVKSWFHRISGASLKRAIEDAKTKR